MVRWRKALGVDAATEDPNLVGIDAFLGESLGDHRGWSEDQVGLTVEPRRGCTDSLCGQSIARQCEGITSQLRRVGDRER